MAQQEIRDALLGMPELRAIPEMTTFVGRIASPEASACWDYAPWACRSVGGVPEDALPAAVAIFASLAAIHLVDDMLDEEPDGLYRSIGPGRAANMALSFQAAASRALAEAELPPMLEVELQGRLARMNMETSLAQHQDVEPVSDEDGYWRSVDMKTPPLFCCALAMGARIGGAERAVADAVGALGRPLGRMIQVSDDLRDALETPASPDWTRPRNNLALLYASTAPHPQREEFVALLERVSESSDALSEAQALLFRSGAGSYCVHRMVEAYRAGRDLLAGLELADPSPLLGLMHTVITPVVGLLQRCGVAEPARLLEALLEESAPSD